ncbi:MAG: transglutaminase-like putative cysteine protease [Glaciecola sp.]|jgi:transglutaminase-like putative cysteine protease
MTFFKSFVVCMGAFIVSVGLFSSPLQAQVVESNSFQYEVVPVPDWIKSRDKRTYKQNADFGMNFHLLDSQYLIQGERREAYRRTVHSISSEQGLQDGAKLEISFNPDFQKLRFHRITRTRNGKEVDILDTKNIRLIQPESDLNMGLITGLVTAIVLLPDVRVGDQIDYSYSINGVNSIFGDKAFTGFSTTWQVPINDSYITVLSDQALQYKIENTPGEVIVTESINSESGLTQYSWSYQDLPPVVAEDNYPYWYNPYGYIEFSSYQSWEEVVNWATELFPYSAELSSAIESQNKQWLAQSSNQKDYINKVIEFTQNDIRYLGLELGQNSHKPHTPIEVFDRRFGDCKDKALLIAALLQNAEIEAHAALISTTQRRKLLQVLPSPGAFNHVVTRFEFEGKEYWIDGTKSFQLTELDNKSISNFQYGLVIKEGEKQLAKVTSPTEHKRDISIFERFDIKDKVSDADVTIDVVYTGSEAERMREYIASAGMKVFQAELFNFYLRTYPDLVEVGSLIKSDDYGLNKLSFTSQFKMTNPFSSGTSQVGIPLYGTNVSSYVELPSVKERKTPIALYEGFTSTHDIEVNLPFSIGWELQDRKIKIEDEGITYTRNIDASPKRIHVVHHYETKSDHIAIENTRQHVSKIRDIREALYFQVTVPNDQSTIKLDLQERLRRALGKTTE